MSVELGNQTARTLLKILEELPKSRRVTNQIHRLKEAIDQSVARARARRIAETRHYFEGDRK